MTLKTGNQWRKSTKLEAGSLKRSVKSIAPSQAN